MYYWVYLNNVLVHLNVKVRLRCTNQCNNVVRSPADTFQY